jgi:hypothetical protein
MKRSNKLLMGLFIFILAGLTVMLVVAKLYTHEVNATEQNSTTSEAAIIIE